MRHDTSSTAGSRKKGWSSLLRRAQALDVLAALAQIADSDPIPEIRTIASAPFPVHP